MVAAALALAACGSRSGGPAPVVVPTGGTSLVAGRLAALAAPEREAWTRYLAGSRQAREADRAAIDAELAAIGRATLLRAPLGSGPPSDERVTDEWLRSEEARRLADAAVSYQTPSGGWSKRVDLRQGPRRPGQGYSSEGDWHYVATFDNGATTGHLRFLSRAARTPGGERYRDAVGRGIAYVLRAQYPNGCWPQVYPLEGGYHDAATYNDDVTADILALLQDVAAGRAGTVGEEVRRRAGASVERGVQCIVASQVRVNGRRTAWGAQHDPLSLQPVGARSYEHPSVDAAASARIVELLMGLAAPGAEVVEAVHAAAGWFDAARISGFEYVRGELVAKPGAGPLWARFSEIGTDRPIFGNRDGVIRYRWSELQPERRYGYSWYTARPVGVLRAYGEWARRHPGRAGHLPAR